MTQQDYYWLNDDARLFLSRGYLREGETAEKRIKVIARNAENILDIPDFAGKFENYMAKGYYSLSTPVWINFGREQGLPVSCYGSYIEDDMQSILYKAAEIGMMSKYGGGTSSYFGDLRSRGSDISGGFKSSGPVHFMEIYNTVSNVVSQGASRRGSCAVYLPVEHPDVGEFLTIRDPGAPIQDLSLGVTITDKWMKSMVKGNKKKRKIWGDIIRKRYESGYPYLFFTDTVNNNKPDVYKDNKLKIYASNLCNEIYLPSSASESFVCVLSSINLVHWDEIKETDAVETLLYFLDAVNQEFVTKSRDLPFMEHAYNFADKHKALGLGVLGWHSMLQKNNIAFESMDAKYLNLEIFETLNQKTQEATKTLYDKFGTSEFLEPYKVRNATRLAIAPTTSSSFILGQISPSVEPLNSNYFVKRLAKGNFSYKNEYLAKVLETYDRNNASTWRSILKHGGSVQHLDFLSDNEKMVFKTFGEISQKEIIIQASQRQAFIDQGQSININIHPSTPPKDVSELMIEAWQLGIKGLYYQRSSNPAQELGRNINNCTSCES